MEPKKQIKESIDYDETEVNPSFLIKDNEYVWIMGAEPLLVYYTGRGKKPGTYNFEFKDKKGNHDLSRRDVKEYIKYKEGSAPGPFGYNSGLNKFKMKESNNDTKLKTSIPQANKNDKFLLYRHKSNSPSPGHDEYLFTSGNTLDELFDNWIEVMRRGGYGYSGSELERQKSLFQKDKLKYWSRPASFYTLKTKRKSDLDQLKMDRDHRRSMASKGYDDDPRESKQFSLAQTAKKILKENSNEVDQLFKFLDHPWQEDGEIEFVSLLDQNRGNFKTSNWAATLRYLRSMDKANSNLSMMASDKFLTMWDDLIK